MITVDPRDCVALGVLKKIAGGTANRAPLVELHTADGMLVAESSDATASGSVRIPCAGELDKVKVCVEPLADVLSTLDAMATIDVQGDAMVVKSARTKVTLPVVHTEHAIIRPCAREASIIDARLFREMSSIMERVAKAEVEDVGLYGVEIGIGPDDRLRMRGGSRLTRLMEIDTETKDAVLPPVLIRVPTRIIGLARSLSADVEQIAVASDDVCVQFTIGDRIVLRSLALEGQMADISKYLNIEGDELILPSDALMRACRRLKAVSSRSEAVTLTTEGLTLLLSARSSKEDRGEIITSCVVEAGELSVPLRVAAVDLYNATADLKSSSHVRLCRVDGNWPAVMEGFDGTRIRSLLMQMR